MKVLCLAILGMLVMAPLAFGQADQDNMLGAHDFGDACFGCHAPHNGGLAYGKSAANGRLILWARSLNTGVYHTYNDTFTLTANTQRTDPVLYSQLCFACHDGASGSSMGDVYVAAKMRVAYNGNLANDHPVHVKYIPGGQYWDVTVTNGEALFSDGEFVLATGITGHPAKLYVSGSDLYVECSTCHDPHRYTNYAFRVKDPTGTVKWVTGGDGSTEHFLRGPYSSSRSLEFCRSCHYGKTLEYFNALK